MSVVDLNCRMEAPGPEPDSPRSGAAKAAQFGASFRDLYQQHVSMAWRGLLRLGVPEAAVEDAVQDVFLVVYRREGDFEARSSLRTWIYGIVVRVAKDYRRADTRHRRRLSEVERLSPQAEPAASPAEHAERKEAARLVRHVLSRMPDAQREVLVLVELMGLSTSEAAEALGCSLRSSQRLLSRARASFENLLASHAAHGCEQEASGVNR